MLDLSHPITPYILEASRYEDQIRQSLVALRKQPAGDVVAACAEILAGPLPDFVGSSHERFEDRPGIASKLDAIESAIVNRRPVEEIWLAFLMLGELSEDAFGTGFI